MRERQLKRLPAAPAAAPEVVVFGIRKHRLPAVLEVRSIGSGINAASSSALKLGRALEKSTQQDQERGL